MDRPLKFRLWDGSTMHYGGYQLWFDEQGDLKEVVPFWEVEAEIMQFTGMKDKNGKDIYEGDIIQTENDGTMSSFYGTVAWGEDGYRIFQAPEQMYNPGLSHRSIISIEVVGNIWENSNLSTR